MVTIFIAVSLSALIWLGLVFFHGRFWRAETWLDPAPVGGTDWPEVVAVIPARDEAAVIARSVASHAASRYPGRYQVILVDDASSDGTAELARAAYDTALPLENVGERGLYILAAPPLPAGWTGKLAAQRVGLTESHTLAPEARYVLLTDADIVHGPDSLTQLVDKADRGKLALVSLMARLDARGIWGGLLIPAFVFFFQKLYPFPRVNDPKDGLAGAAGGCMLADRAVLEAAGGFEAVKDALIDDCAVAALVKGKPPTYAIWLGLTHDVVSLRDNRALSSVWTMVSRTAYAQLSYAPLLLAGTVLGMALIYLAGPLAVLSLPVHGSIPVAGLGALCWGAMVLTYAPTLRVYGRPAWHGLALPLAALLYTAMTVSSAWAHWRGRGGAWKGRTYGRPPG